MDQPPPPSSKATTALTHTGTIVGILTGIVAIASFFGIHAATSSEKPAKPQTKAQQAADTSEPGPRVTKHEDVHKRGIGTIRLSGGFPPGTPMIASEALHADKALLTVKLVNPANRREETLSNALVLADVPQGQLAGMWREGTRFVDDLKLTSAYIQLSGAGIDSQVPVSADGKLLANVLWPAKAMFTDVAFPGPLDIHGWTLPNGLIFGDSGTGEGGKTLPEHFALDIPKPGEALGAIRGDVRYAGGWRSDRKADIQALAPDGGTAATWSCPLDPNGRPAADAPNATLDQGLAGIRVLFGR